MSCYSDQAIAILFCLCHKLAICDDIFQFTAIFEYDMENGTIPDGTTIYDFILKAIPEDLKAEVTASLIDEVYAGVSKAHGS